MSIYEACMTVIALSAGAIALAAWVVLARVLPVLRRVEILAADAATSLQRLNGIAADLEGVVRDARRLEKRVSNTAGVLLDQVEPPVRVVSALLAGARAGVGSLFSSGGRRAATGGSQLEGNMHERSTR